MAGWWVQPPGRSAASEVQGVGSEAEQAHANYAIKQAQELNASGCRNEALKLLKDSLLNLGFLSRSFKLEAVAVAQPSLGFLVLVELTPHLLRGGVDLNEVEAVVVMSARHRGIAVHSIFWRYSLGLLAKPDSPAAPLFALASLSILSQA